MIARALTPEWQVIGMASGAEAVEAIRSGFRFAAIICDVNLPDTHGFTVHDAIAAIAAEQAEQVIFTTTGVDRASVGDPTPRRLDPVLVKPYTVSALRATVRTIVQREHLRARMTRAPAVAVAQGVRATLTPSADLLGSAPACAGCHRRMTLSLVLDPAVPAGERRAPSGVAHFDCVWCDSRVQVALAPRTP